MRNCNERRGRKRKGALSKGKERSYIFSSLNPLTTDTFYGLLIISVCINGVDCTTSLMSIIMMNSTK